MIPKISVIVPVYNTEKYLRRCVESILIQTFTDFELLLIDDGSTDSSGAICEEYAQKDSRVRVFHQENGGVTSARKLGVENVLGEWVSFIDSDDYIYESYLNDFLNNISAEDELLACSNNDRIVSNTYFINDLLFDRIAWGMVMKLFRVDILRNNNAINVSKRINIGEDLIGNILIAKSINKVKYILNNGYLIGENDESVTRSRKWSIEYETIFLNFVRNILENENSVKEGLWLLYLRSVKNLLLNGIKVPRSNELYRYVIENKQNIQIGVGDKIVLRNPFPIFSMFVLRLLNCIKK